MTDWLWTCVWRREVILVLPVLLAGCGGETAENAAEAPASEVATPAQEAGPQTLTLADFDPFQAEESTWREEEGMLICSGTPKGYIHTRETYGNYVWEAEYRFAPVEDEEKRPLANTGFMIHIQEPQKVWPASLEVQGRWDEMASIKSNGGIPDLTIDDDPEARESARKPVGEWNHIRIESRDGALTSWLNGEKICESQPGELTSGQIGLQSEGFEVHFRNVTIEPVE
ncbi:hypothetical protein Mal4_22010 [Maioricimonas rarisocia]|uniref:3-keto-alpha-glucoside-1,2-lyase/3-keto-2-hydroxy-glucal hydratase domain-containing protein n=1 Tax=Maioricimonas rarisocia TaxID=2528026 RepID=A0A517Z5W0_9PLAN|nr:DUF1080 domain-containing protein [Maioricimonas rarisocia]QDU37882.1 hypothetical protein Mal4_22010 [Maioricimonas rarisocia]